MNVTVFRTKYFALVILGFALQILGFWFYIQQNSEGYYGDYGDQNWYLYFHHNFSEAISRLDFDLISDFFAHSQWGGLYFLSSALTQLALGISRTNTILNNLIFHLGAQLFIFWVVSRKFASPALGFLVWLIFLSLETSVRTSAGAMNIGNYHMDLNFFMLITITLGFAILSEGFLDRKNTICFGLLVGITVAYRLAGFFLFFPILLAFGFLMLPLKFVLRDRVDTNRRIKNFLIAGLISGAIAFPFVWIAREPLYGHYFRFLLDKEFSETKTNLYNFVGVSDKFGEGLKLAKLIAVQDFGLAFFLASGIIFLGLFKFIKRCRPTSPDRWILFFLIVFTILSFTIHWSFKIKSDHLTRMTTAPLFWLFAFAVASTLKTSNWENSVSAFKRRTFLAIFALIPLVSHANFYFNRRPSEQEQKDNLQIVSLYDKIIQLTGKTGITSPGISVDHIRSFELGAMYSLNSFAYEQHQIFMVPNGQLGAVIDEPLPWENVQNKLDRTDIFLLTENDVYSGETPFFPFGKSVQAYHKELQALVRDQFCRIQEFEFSGNKKTLYFRPNANWKMEISTPHVIDRRRTLDGYKVWEIPESNDGQTTTVTLSGMRSIVRGLNIEGQPQRPLQAPSNIKIRIYDGEALVDQMDMPQPVFDRFVSLRWQFPKAHLADRIVLEIRSTLGPANVLSFKTVRPLIELNSCGTKA